MELGDVIIDKDLSNDEIVATISELFSVSEADILIVDDILQTKVSEQIRILCVRMKVGGDFSLRLDFYLRDPKLKQLDEESIMRQFCSITHCNCLLPDSSVNPYSWLLVRESGDVQTVSLAPERFDEEEYVIIK